MKLWAGNDELGYNRVLNKQIAGLLIVLVLSVLK
jgi:hypothetical protein